jgi:long-chain acyl-CoA synthetase
VRLHAVGDERSDRGLECADSHNSAGECGESTVSHIIGSQYDCAVDPRESIDGYDVEWPDFAAMFLARDDSAAVFLVDLDHERGTRRQWTVAEWRRVVVATADWLRSRGVTPGGSVAAMVGNRAEALAVAYACWLVQACYVPLNPADDPARHAYILRDADVDLFIHAEDAGPLVTELHAETSKTASDSHIPIQPAEAALTWLPTQPAVVHAGLEAPALLVYTSGTTGAPKGVQLTMRNLLTDCDGLIDRLQWPSETRILTVLPVHHVNGLVISSLLPWVAGFSTVLCDRFRSELFWNDAASEGATVCSVVPSLLEFLLKAPPPERVTLRELLCGAGPLLVDTVLRSEEEFGIPIRHLYGLSETTAVVTLMPRMPLEERQSWYRDHGQPSVGPSLAHARVSVLGQDGEEVAEGVRGELVIRGAIVMRGYQRLAEETRTSLRDGWFHSGDEGFWIASGDQRYFFITSRIKELIIRGGTNISPIEIDTVLCSHPAVDYGLALPFENRYYGEEIAAYVVTNAPVSDAELISYCLERLNFARTPKVIVRGNDVPYTTTGKAKRIELASRLAPDLAIYRDHQFRKPGAAKLTDNESTHNTGGEDGW